MKGLSIQPPFALPTRSTTAEVSEPVSLSFIKPQIPAMKRKPSHLSLRTTTHELIKSTTIEVPQSPSLLTQPILQRRALKHSTSSPHILSSLKSSTFGPQGGMTFPTVLERNKSGLSEFLRPSKPAGPLGLNIAIVEEESPIRAQMANSAIYDVEPYHENENNEDQKSPCYPDGPIAIYDDNVYLYLEPTAEEASRFDVVINVAREVPNPFDRSVAKPPARNSLPSTQQHSRWQPTPLQSRQPQEARMAVPNLAPILEPESEHQMRIEAQQTTFGTEPMVVDPAIPVVIEPLSDTTTTISNSSSRLKRKALSLSISLTLPTTTEASKEDDTPTTPKAILSLKEPEYIHIPWDHNTDIGSDLMVLCETIDKRRKEGKKILIHCQQGASRSASLIIAYGMFQNPHLTVNDSYYAAQAKSKWISPNMRLMYCLQDFQKEVNKRRALSNSWSRPGRSSTKHRAAFSVDAIEISRQTPLSAPLPASNVGSKEFMSSPRPERSPLRLRGKLTPSNRESIPPGPSSAPSSFSWTEKDGEKDAKRCGRFDFGFKSTTLLPHFTALDSCGSGLALSDAGLRGGLVEPPPSPGFAAHRSSQLADKSGSNLSSPGLPPLHFGFLPTGFSSSNVLDSILAERASTTHGVSTEAPAHTPKTSFFALPSTSFHEVPVAEKRLTGRPAYVDDGLLMSPRAETMTNNPLHAQFADISSNMCFVEVPPTPSESDLFSPRECVFPSHTFFPPGRPKQVDDPRSPPTKGETPIVRSIDDLI
ncbi:tyrosine/serine/threonine protein phosphatase [Sporothrix epigloea]|uniref:protein-tyrosine-phosphatase n=1 Tax=Sporothrix epigloea TaxID=1892477 RepID=A0ABP0DTK3_9PEZI